MHFILWATNLEVKMNSLSDINFTTERRLFPVLEEEIGELTGKMKEFLRLVEVIRPTLKNMIFCDVFKKKSRSKHQKWF